MCIFHRNGIGSYGNIGDTEVAALIRGYIKGISGGGVIATGIEIHFQGYFPLGVRSGRTTRQGNTTSASRKLNFGISSHISAVGRIKEGVLRALDSLYGIGGGLAIAGQRRQNSVF